VPILVPNPGDATAIGQLSLASPGVAKSSTKLIASAGGKGGSIISAEWQVTLCDPTWHVRSRSGVAM